MANRRDALWKLILTLADAYTLISRSYSAVRPSCQAPASASKRPRSAASLSAVFAPTFSLSSTYPPEPPPSTETPLKPTAS
jgi:hypothetical protein